MSGCLSTLLSARHSLSRVSMPLCAMLACASLLAPIEITVTGCASSFFTSAMTCGVISLAASGGVGLEADWVASGCSGAAVIVAGGVTALSCAKPGRAAVNNIGTENKIDLRD